MSTRARLAVLALAGLGVTGCSVHPGDAAVVDGQSISMRKLDDTAKVYCTLTLRSASQQGVKTVSNLDVRQQAATALVTRVVARKVAKAKGVTPAREAYELTPSQRVQVAKAFPKQDASDLEDAIQDSQEIYAISLALGEKSTGQTRTDANESSLAETGQAEIAKAFGRNKVRFAPRLGLTRSGAATSAASGSLSVTGVDFEAPTDDELPTAQRCS